MSTDPLDALWHSPSNRPPAGAGERLAEHFVRRLRRQRRLQGAWLAWTFVALASVTGLAVVHLVKRGAGGFAGQGTLVPLLVLPWSAALLFLGHFLRDGAARCASGVSLHAALVAARAANAAERRRLIVVGILLGATLPIAALAVRQLHVAGKTSVDQAWSMALVFGLALAGGGGFVAWRYRRHLRPERHRIDSLLSDLESSRSH